MSNQDSIIKVIDEGLGDVKHLVEKRINEVEVKVNDLMAKNGKLGWTSSSTAVNGDYSEFQTKELHSLIGSEYKTIASGLPFQTKTVGDMTMSANLTGTSQVSYLSSPMMRSYYDPHLYDIFRIIPTATGNVTFPRATTGTGEGSFGDQTEGQAKAQVDYDVTMVNINLPFVAGYAKVSRQMLQDLPFLQGYLSSSLMEDWNRRYNVKCLNTIATNATAGSSSATEPAERVIDFVSQHLAQGLGKPTAIITTHAAWGRLLKTLPSGGSYSFPGGVSVDANGTIRIVGIPVIAHQQVIANRAYVINTNNFATAQASGLSIRSTETDGDDFIKNLVTYRCEARVELVSFQPTAAVYGIIT